MDEAQRKCLRQNHMLLLDELNPCDIIDNLYQDGILDKDYCDEIESCKTRKEKCRSLLLLLPRCGPSAYGLFLKSLKKGKYSHLANALRLSLQTSAEPVKACRHFIPEFAVQKLGKLFKQNCCCIFKNVEANDLLDLHYQERVLGVEEYERIKRGKSQLERWERFISELSKCTCSQVTSVFERSLEKKYGFIANELNKATLHMPLVPSPPRSRNLEKLFNHISTMLTQGNFQNFKIFATNLELKHSEDMMCILDYFYATCDLNVTRDIESAERHVNTGMQRVARTSYPNYFIIELSSAQIRVKLAQRKPVENILDNAMMIISSDPIHGSGAAAGWLLMNYVKHIFNQLAALSVHHQDYATVFKSLQDKAIKICKKALDIFHSDGGDDGRFGQGFALCRLATLLLRCGENGSTMDIQYPDSEDIELAGKHLEQLENSNVPIPKMPKVHFLLAKSDLQYRKDNHAGALVYANAAHKLAIEINIKEFIAYAHNRVIFLETLHRSSGCTGGVTESC